jgi:branched-chain amino acid transport system permease protein
VTGGSAIATSAGSSSAWVGGVLRVGLIGSAVSLYVSLNGIVPIFHARPLINNTISLGQTALVLTVLGAGYLATRRAPHGATTTLAAGALAGAISGVSLSVLLLIGLVAGIDVRAVFIQASPVLYDVLTFGLGEVGFWVPVAVGMALGAAAGAISVLPRRFAGPLVWGLTSLLIVGLFSSLLRSPLLGTTPGLARFLFAAEGLTREGAVLVFFGAVAWRTIWPQAHVRQRVAAIPKARRTALLLPIGLAGIAFFVLLPQILGGFVAHVVAFVALYILMGFGLNITLGLAGLLDLGFVAFFAVGAYTVGLFTSLSELGLLRDVGCVNLVAGFALCPNYFWFAVPFAVLFAMAFGAFLGLPILGIRGDYLAIATLGFGEIIRILAGSNLLLPWLGGPQGIINIPKPIDVPPGDPLAGAFQIYYIALIFAAIIWFVAIRLRDSRLGRAWVAIREDEDVAEALGISLVQTKLLAYMLGAAFAGLGGAVFAGLIGSVFYTDINLFVSINVVALIIVGGMGSFPGVVVGAIFLIGLPELFREFAEYRFLFYGMALIAMMIYRPAGLFPSRIAERELHVPEAVEPTASGAALAGETGT